jgi:hypothetical protein
MKPVKVRENSHYGAYDYLIIAISVFNMILILYWGLFR